MSELLEVTCKDCVHYCLCKDTVADENWSDETPEEIRLWYSPRGCENYMPATDAVPVKRGEWVAYETDETYGDDDSKEWYRCSECGTDALGRCYEDEWYSFPIRSDYCPRCGAKMNGGSSDEK